MKLRFSDLTIWVAALALTALSVLSSLLLPENPVTYALMIPFFLFLPGYAITKIFFSRKLELDLFLLTSIALSLVSSILVALVLLITPIKLSQMSVLIAIGGLTFVALAADFLIHRERRRFEIEIAMPRKEDIDPVIAIAIVFGLVLICIFSYIILTSHPPSSTSINLLSENGDIDLPSNVAVGGAVNFTVVMKNGEGRSAEFEVLIFNNSVLYNGSESAQNSYVVTVDDGQTVEHDFNLMFSEAGVQDIRARVLIDGEFYGELHFQVDVD